MEISMDVWQVVILGIVQGASEFLPISSTAHLILTPYLFGWPDLGLVFDVSLHLGTLLAVVIFFRDKWRRILTDKKLLALLVLATLPGFLFGALLESKAASVFRLPAFIAFNLAFFGLTLWVVDKWGSKRKDVAGLGKIGAVFIGFCQALAILPGVSRSGATITGGLLFGLKREEAVEFSFLISAPIIFGSVVWEGRKIIKGAEMSGNLGLWATGILVSFISGYLAIKFLLKFVKKHTFLPFVIYRVILALLIVFLVISR